MVGYGLDVFNPPTTSTGRVCVFFRVSATHQQCGLFVPERIRSPSTAACGAKTVRVRVRIGTRQLPR